MAIYFGTSGNDVLGGVGDVWTNTSTNDSLFAGAGNDVLRYDLSKSGGYDLYAGQAGVDTLELLMSASQWGVNNVQISSLAATVAAKTAAGGGVADNSLNPTLVFGFSNLVQTSGIEAVRVMVEGVQAFVAFDGNDKSNGSVIEAGSPAPTYANNPGQPYAQGKQNLPPAAAGDQWYISSAPAGASGTGTNSSVDPLSGSFSIDAKSGIWTYQLNNGLTGIEDMQTGQSMTVTWFVAAGSNPATPPSAAPRPITITINGTDDRATAVVNAPLTPSGQPDAVWERGGTGNSVVTTPNDGTPETAGGTVLVTNVDGTPVDPSQNWAPVTNIVTGMYGQLTLQKTGYINDVTALNWTYTINQIDPDTQALKAGEVVVETIKIDASNNKAMFDAYNGAVMEFKVTITGADDFATIGQTNTDTKVKEAGGVNNNIPGDTSANGAFTLTDPDGGPASLSALGTVLSTVGTVKTIQGTYGTFTFDSATNAWTYTLIDSRAATEALQMQAALGVEIPAASETLTVRLDQDPTVTSTITVNVFGADDYTQKINNAYGTAGGTVTEPTPYSVPAIPTVTPPAGGTTPVSVSPDATADGTLTPVDTDGYFGGSSAVTPPPSIPASPVQNYVLYDWKGGVITPPGGATSGAFTIPGQYGLFTIPSLFPINPQPPTPVAWSYTLLESSPGYADVDWLGAGKTTSDVFYIQATDSLVTQTVVVQILGVNDPALMQPVTGAGANIGLPYVSPNDGGSALPGGLLIEYGGLNNALQLPAPGADTLSGFVKAVDVDQGESSWLANVSKVGTFGTFNFTASTGAWSYKIDNNQANVQALGPASIVTETFNILALDGTTHAITVTIQGASDTAVITGSTTDSVTEAGGVIGSFGYPTLNDPNAAGDVDVNDPDGPTFNFFQPVANPGYQPVASPSGYPTAPAPFGNYGGTTTVDPNLNDVLGVYGDFTFNPSTGAWTYSLRNDFYLTDALGAGDVRTDRMLVYSIDGSASQMITVTINGTPDVSALSNTYTDKSVQAEGTYRNTAGTWADATADYQADGTISGGSGTFVAPAAAQLQGVYGQFAFNTTTGAWTYTLDNEDPDTLALQPNPLIGAEGAALPGAQEFLTVQTTGGQTLTVVVDVFGAYTRPDIKGPASDTNYGNLSTGNMVAGAAPQVNSNGSITFTARNGEAGETMTLWVASPTGSLAPTYGGGSGTTAALSPLALLLTPGGGYGVTVNDGTVSTLFTPNAPVSGRVVNNNLFLFDGDFNHGALDLGVSLTQGTDGIDNYTMTGTTGGIAAGYGENDVITGNVGTDYIDGGDGNDTLYGLAGNDTILGGEGDDLVDGGANDDSITGGNGNDELRGGFGSDTLVGGAGNDWLVGELAPGASADRLVGGAGKDTMTGAGGADVFVFGGNVAEWGDGTDFDVIGLQTAPAVFSNDFTPGTDKLEFALSILGGVPVGPGAWYEEGAGLTAAATADGRLIFDTTTGYLYYDADGAGGAAAIQLAWLVGVGAALGTGDFTFTP